jgi:hypothetical protein
MAALVAFSLRPPQELVFRRGMNVELERTVASGTRN